MFVKILTFTLLTEDVQNALNFQSGTAINVSVFQDILTSVGSALQLAVKTKSGKTTNVSVSNLQ